MLKLFISKFFRKVVYPTYSGDWYSRKKYVGTTDIKRFNDFVKKQRDTKAIYYKEFKSLKLTRKFLNSGNVKIDTVTLKPVKSLSKNKPGEGLYIICFQGKGEYYEARFRDMAFLSRKTGASVIGFNPKGFHSSSGKTRLIDDIINDGIALVEYLLASNVETSKIIFYGNSLGCAIAYRVNEHFKKLSSLNFRQINSNSFKTIAAVFTSNLNVSFLQHILYPLMKYAGWEITYNENYYQTGIYRCFLRRQNDKTIKYAASFASCVNKKKDKVMAPIKYRRTLEYLNYNAELIYPFLDAKDPHDVSLHKLRMQIKGKDGKNLTPWYFINKYLEGSNKFIGNNYEE